MNVLFTTIGPIPRQPIDTSIHGWGFRKSNICYDSSLAAATDP